MKPILFYHAKCPDGFGSAYAFWRKFGDSIEYYPLSFYDELPDITDRVVYMADIALERQPMLEVYQKSKEVTVIDHHLSAERNLGDLDFCHFDMNHSGAVLAWKFNFPDEEVPMLLRYIEDRDLWKFELPYAKEVLAAVDSYDRTFENWHKLDERIGDPSAVADLLKEGNAILRYNKILIERLKSEIHTLIIRGYEVPAINTPFFRSELVGELSESAVFAAGYHFDGEKFVFSLRARGDSIDVSKIAGSFEGGGGHKVSAGFSIKTLKGLSD